MDHTELCICLLPAQGYWSKSAHVGGCIITAIFALMLFFVIRSYVRKKRRCTAGADAEVIDLRVSVSHDSDGDTTTYAPVYRFWYGGEEHTVTSNIYSSGRQYAVGDRVTLMIDPENPETFFDPGRDRKNAIFFGAIAALFLLFGIGAMLS